MLNDAQHEYVDGSIAPGETGRALLTLAMPELQKGRLFDGMEFTVQEGGRIVGHGRIIKVLNRELRQAV